MYVTGVNTTIVQALRAMRSGEEISRLPTGPGEAFYPKRHDRYLFAQGLLRSKRIDEQTEADAFTSLSVNLTQVMLLCELILKENPNARICIIGSESGIHGSYDQTYAAAKAGVHQYIRTRRVGPHQQLVGIAPAIIEDSGMTQRRTDLQMLLKRTKKEHPKKRLLTAGEVAQLIHFLLFTDRGYICNTVIEMDGGKHAQK